ncbi:Similar to predicted protein [Laccaria bicolor S238N-H82]; acc. no. XP_001880984 [Pyronema omphalodes CBS 100304]|uniref:Uncharacterized protein n=1 Tax=Pyronema omphalodes (strain CBS 100304) TaxID=1076935 RepID=U4LFS5_PYROM|nr:Similar to predicted protein [Laccaria bicolor S238N-H82]; acc. no. XP_001880984 [Pyronema omphalodes CBS 100304]
MSKRRAETPPVRESATKSIDSVNVHEDFLSELPGSELVKTWDSTTLLSWLKALKPSPLGTVHFANTATAFKQADISGRAFLRATANWLEEKCHIFAGPAMDLEGLAAEINAAKQNEQSITAPKMRKTVLEHTAKILNSKIHRLPVEVEEFCDPWNREYLPFPFPGMIPLHFKLDNDRQFFYYGRTDFRLLYEKVILLNPYQTKNLAVYGPFGGGKSHMLAALVCLLGRLKKTVVYIPDCHGLNTPSRYSYLIQALVFAFANDHLLGEKITELARICEDNSDPKELEPKVISFCNEAASKGQFILFVLDQADSLDENSSKIIRHIITPHMTITCSNKKSVDCQLYVPAQASLFITGELDEEEMEAWWGDEQQLWDNIDLDHLTYLENFTERIPEFLSQLSEVGNVLYGDNPSGHEVEKQSRSELSGLKHDLITALRGKKETTEDKNDSSDDSDDDTDNDIRLYDTFLMSLNEPINNKSETENADDDPDDDVIYKKQNPSGPRDLCDLIAGSDRFRSIVDSIRAFADHKIEQLKVDPTKLAYFYRLWDKCILGAQVERNAIDNDFLDGRFFFIKDGRAQTSCWLARDVAASYLRSVQHLGNDDAMTDWLSMGRASSERRDRSTMMELAKRLCLSRLIITGISWFTAKVADTGIKLAFNKSMQPTFIRGRRAEEFGQHFRLQPIGQLVIHIPTDYAYDGVDAIVTSIAARGNDRVAVVTGIFFCDHQKDQERFSSAEVIFMENHAKSWQTAMGCSLGLFFFLWVLPQRKGNRYWKTVERNQNHPSYSYASATFEELYPNMFPITWD